MRFRLEAERIVILRHEELTRQNGRARASREIGKAATLETVAPRLGFRVRKIAIVEDRDRLILRRTGIAREKRRRGVQLLSRSIVADSAPSLHRRIARLLAAKQERHQLAAAAVLIGTAPCRVLWASAVTAALAVTAQVRGRNSICGSQSCEVRLTDREANRVATAVIEAPPAMVEREEHRATAGRIAPRATAAEVMRRAVVEVTPLVEEEGTPAAVAEVAIAAEAGIARPSEVCCPRLFRSGELM